MQKKLLHTKNVLAINSHRLHNNRSKLFIINVSIKNQLFAFTHKTKKKKNVDH